MKTLDYNVGNENLEVKNSVESITKYEVDQVENRKKIRV